MSPPLFVLEFGADKFIDHTAIVARRTGISRALIGLLTAGAEWEEVRLSDDFHLQKLTDLCSWWLLQHLLPEIARPLQSEMLLAPRYPIFLVPSLLDSCFIRPAKKSCSIGVQKIYSLLLLFMTLFVTLLTFLGTRGSWKIFGGILLALLVIYVVSAACAISHGAITAPELSDEDDEDDDSSDRHSDVRHRPNGGVETESRAAQDAEAASAAVPTNTTPDGSSARQGSQHRTSRHKRHSLKYHIAFLLVGFISMCLSGYVLSHASTTINDEIGTSDVLFGVVILSIATTLPEKFIAVLSGFRGHAGILIANYT
jgi:hypothetical protein